MTNDEEDLGGANDEDLDDEFQEDVMDHDEDDFGGENDDMKTMCCSRKKNSTMNDMRIEDMMRRLGTNDPSLTTLRVGLCGHQPPNRDWGSLGRAIGMNIQLIKNLHYATAYYYYQRMTIN